MLIMQIMPNYAIIISILTGCALINAESLEFHGVEHLALSASLWR